MNSFEGPGWVIYKACSREVSPESPYAPDLSAALRKAAWGVDAVPGILQADKPHTWHLAGLLQVQDIPDVEFCKG